MREHSVLVVDGNPRQLRSLERVLKSVVRTVEARDSLDEVPADGTYNLIALSYDTLSPERRADVVKQLGHSGASTRLMLFSGGNWENDHRELFNERLLTNLLAKNGEEVGADELLVTINKILARDIFGVEKYFPWGSGVDTRRTTSSSDKESIVAAAREFARNLGVNDRLTTSFAVVTDELLTNALYNAPVDDQGNHPYASRDRALPVSLAEKEAIEVKFCSDGRKIGVSVSDPFGSLTAAIVLDYLAKCFRREEDQIDKKPGGAGLGLFQAFGSVSHLVINISPGHRCEAIGMIDVRGSFKDFARQAKSFNIFVDKEAR